MLEKGSWIPKNSAIKKALSAQKTPPKPVAPNMRDY
jgi:hypothetical protein